MAFPLAAAAQLSPPPLSNRPALEWRTLQTQFFDVHYPRELSEWARMAAARLDAAHEAVVPLVGYTPPRTHVVIDEVGHVAGGFAWPLLDGPAIFLWPDQQMPVFGRTHHRPDPLIVHEFTHMAHMTRPSRNAWERIYPRLLPPSWTIGPIILKSPEWAIEGYGAYAEGKVLGSGTPASSTRA